MRYRSEKRQKLYVERRALVEKLLKERPVCEACWPRAGYEMVTGRPTGRKWTLTRFARPSEDVHEIKRRSQGGSIIDPNNLLVVCRDCHRWINNYPEFATKLGLSLPGWATDEMYEEAVGLRDDWGLGRPCQPSWWS